MKVTNSDESLVLPTYPLKVAFLKEVDQHPDVADWSVDHYSERYLHILNVVERRSLTGYVLKDDQLLAESDNGHLIMITRTWLL